MVWFIPHIMGSSAGNRLSHDVTVFRLSMMNCRFVLAREIVNHKVAKFALDTPTSMNSSESPPIVYPTPPNRRMDNGY